MPVDRAAGVLLRLDTIAAPVTYTLRGGSSLTSLAGIPKLSAPDLSRTRHIAASSFGGVDDIAGRGDETLLLRPEPFARTSCHALRGVPSVTSLAGPGKAIGVLIDGNELAPMADS